MFLPLWYLQDIDVEDVSAMTTTLIQPQFCKQREYDLHKVYFHSALVPMSFSHALSIGWVGAPDDVSKTHCVFNFN